MRDSLTCIVIDDERLFIRKMEALIDSIEWLDLQASFTEPVKAASAIIRLKPQLIFLDLQMPHMNGYDLVDWLYPTLQMKGLQPHIVAISGSELESHAMRDQFLCHIPKSSLHSYQVLRDEVQRHLGPVSA